MIDMASLADQIEGARSPDRLLDGLVWAAVHEGGELPAGDLRVAANAKVTVLLPGGGKWHRNTRERYVTDIRDAGLLAPSGSLWRIDSRGFADVFEEDMGGGHVLGFSKGAATPIMGLVAACLRARFVRARLVMRHRLADGATA